MEESEFIIAVKKLELKDNDILVLKYKGRVSTSTSESVNRHASSIFEKGGLKNVQIMILEEGIEIEGILRKE